MRRLGTGRRALGVAGVLTVGLGAAGVAGGGPLHLLGVAAANCVAPTVTGIGGSGNSGHAAQGSTVTITGSNLDEGSHPLCSSTLTVAIGGYQVSINSGSGSASSQSFTLSQPAFGAVTVTDGDGHVSNNNLVFVTDPTVGTLPSNPTAAQTLTASGSRLDLGAGSWARPASVSYSASGGSCPSAVTASIASGGGSLSLPKLGQFCRASATLSLPWTADTATGRVATLTFGVGSLVVAPTVGSLSPGSGPAGSQVTVSGSGFGTSGSARVGGVAASSSWTDGGVTLTLPDTTQGGAVSMVRSDGVSINAGNVTVSGRIDSVNPGSAAPGTSVTVSGGGFGSQTGSVSVAGTSARVTSWSPTSVVFTMPGGTHGSGVTLTPVGGNQVSGPLTSSAAISGVSPGHGVAGTLVQVTGSGFGSSTGSAAVGGLQANVQLWGDLQVVVQVPGGVSPGPTTISVTPPGQSSVTAPFAIDSPASSSGGSGGSSSSVAGSSSAPGSTSTADTSSSTSGPAIPSFIAPSANGPIISTNPVNFQPPPKAAGPVALSLTPSTDNADPGKDVPFTVALVAFGKPVSGAKVSLQLVVEPGSDATITPAEAVTDDAGKVTGTLHLSSTAGDHIVLATSGQYSDEIRVVGRGADTGAVAGIGQAGPQQGRTDEISTITSGAPRLLIVGGLVLCLFLFLTGFAIQMLVPRTRTVTVAGGTATAPATMQRRERRTLLELGEGMASVVQFVAVALAVLVTLPLVRLGRLVRGRRG